MLFKLGDDSLENHRNERRVRTLETEISTVSIEETASEQPQNDEVELKIEASDDEDTVQLEAVQEESEEMGQKVEAMEAEQGDQIMFMKVAKLNLEKGLLFVKIESIRATRSARF